VADSAISYQSEPPPPFYAGFEPASDENVLDSTGPSLAQLIEEKEELEKMVVMQQQRVLDLAHKQIASNDVTTGLQKTIAQLQNTVNDLVHTVNGPSKVASNSANVWVIDSALRLAADIARAEGKGAMAEIHDIKKFLVWKHSEIERRERGLENITDHLERRLRIVDDLAEGRFETKDGTTINLLKVVNRIILRLAAVDIGSRDDMRRQVQTDVDALEARFTAEIGRHDVFEKRYQQHIGAMIRVSSEHSSDIGKMRKAIKITRDGLIAGMASMSSRMSRIETAVQAEIDITTAQD